MPLSPQTLDSALAALDSLGCKDDKPVNLPDELDPPSEPEPEPEVDLCPPLPFCLLMLCVCVVSVQFGPKMLPLVSSVMPGSMWDAWAPLTPPFVPSVSDSSDMCRYA